MKKRKITFPHFGNYYVPLEYFMTRGMEMDYITPPPMTRRTLEIGAKYSPDYVCAPFKIHLGCYIEAIERGADTLVQVGGPCRLGYYGELHEQILKDLGYNVEFVNLARVRLRKPKTIIEQFKKINPHINYKKAAAALLTAKEMVESIDQVEDYMRRNIGFEAERGSFESLFTEYLRSMAVIEGPREIKYVANHYMKRFKALPVKMPKKPLRVGVVGEYYSIMDPFSNHYIEEEMAKMGVMVERWMNVSNTIFHYPGKEIRERIRGYSKYNMGATAMSTIERALRFAKRGYDGIIHLKSFGCTPEMDAMPVLQNISADYKIPILYFSFDSQTADTGIQTRLEAFYDMMTMRKDAQP